MASMQRLPNGAGFNPRNTTHKRIIKSNNTLMLNAFDKALANSKNNKIKNLTDEQREGFAKFLTAQAIHESVHGTKVAGNNNYGGRKASEAQIAAGQATLTDTNERQGGQTVLFNGEGFLNFDSLDDFANDQVQYMDRKFPEFYKATDYTEVIRSLMNESEQVYATDLFKRGDAGNIFDANMHTNQYAIKIANYMGHATEGFLMPPPRPDMVINNNGTDKKSDDYWEISRAGKSGTMVERRGIDKYEYTNKKQYRLLSNLDLTKESKDITEIDPRIGGKAGDAGPKLTPADGGPVGTDARSMDLGTMLPDGMLDQSMRKIYDNNDLHGQEYDQDDGDFMPTLDTFGLNESNSEYRIEDKGISQSDIMGGSTGAMDTTPDPLDVANDSLIIGK